MMEKANGPWFWDVFPNHCTKAWYGFMIMALVVSLFWRDPTYTWWANHLWISVPTISLLIVLVMVGNTIPGIPNMPAPLIIGWACAAGMHPALVALFGILIWNAATFGSLVGYFLGDSSSIPFGWELQYSKRYQSVEEYIGNHGSEGWYILSSRVGKFAAYCGHVNIAAGESEHYYWFDFLCEATLGHFLWTLQYISVGFAIGWLLPYIGQWIR